MKELVLGTVLGTLVIRIRDTLHLLSAAFQGSEQIGCEANDQLAIRLTSKLCLPHKTFMDVGAHIGSVISLVLDQDPTISIVAIEASENKAEKLKKKFPDIEVHSCAVSDEEGEASFFVNTKQSGYNSLGKPSENDIGNIVEITVPVRRLDNIITSENIDIIKVDVEGAELGVLRGGEIIISKNRPVVMFESGTTKKDGLGFSKEDIWHWFNEHNFELLVPNRVAHLGPGLTKEGFLEAHLFPRRTTNYFAIPVERRAEIRERARDVLGVPTG